MHRGAVVITGASTGIGESCALHLDSLDFRVFAGVRKAADGEALVAKATGDLSPLMLDVLDQAGIQAAVELVTAEVGEAGLAGLVNNAGIAVGGPMEFVPMEELRRQFDVNVFGLVATTQAFLPLLRLAKGRVVHMGSAAGLFAAPFLGPYSASKHALEAISDSMRNELAPAGVHVSLIEPGSIATPIWEKSEAAAQDVRSGMGPRLEELYGPRLSRFEKLVKKTAERGIPAIAVAQAVEDALIAPRPAARYLVGKDAKMQAKLRRWVPDRVMDHFIQKVFTPKKRKGA